MQDLFFKVGLISILVAFFYLAPANSFPVLRIDSQHPFEIVAKTVFSLMVVVIPASTILALALVSSLFRHFE